MAIIRGNQEVSGQCVSTCFKEKKVFSLGPTMIFEEEAGNYNQGYGEVKSNKLKGRVGNCHQDMLHIGTRPIAITNRFPPCL